MSVEYAHHRNFQTDSNNINTRRATKRRKITAVRRSSIYASIDKCTLKRLTPTMAATTTRTNDGNSILW